MDDFDEFKKTAAFLDDLEEEDEPKESENQKTKKQQKRKTENSLTPGQKFLLSVMFFLFVLIAGIFLMLVTGKMVLPV